MTHSTSLRPCKIRTNMTTSITTSITVGITYGPYVMADVENRTRNEITDAEFNFFVKNL